MKIDEQDRGFIAKIKKKIPSDDQRMVVFMTILGASAFLSQELMDRAIEEDYVDELSLEVKYAVSLIGANLLTLISDDEQIELLNFKDYEMNEQTQENIYRKFKHIILHLYKNIQDNEKVLE
jgi:hypothetical protein